MPRVITLPVGRQTSFARHLAVDLALAFALTACTPPVLHERVESAAVPPGFPAREYRQLVENGAHVFAVDAKASRVLIEVGRAGRLARLGHEHAIVAHDVQGYVAPQAGRADFYVRVGALSVDEPDARREAGFHTQPSAEDIAGTRENMLHKVLVANLHPFVLVRARGVPIGGVPRDLAIEVNGHERVVPVSVRHGEDGKRLVASGHFSIDQTDFGIVPFSVLGGALQVRDQVDVRFRIEAQRVDAAAVPATLGHTLEPTSPKDCQLSRPTHEETTMRPSVPNPDPCYHVANVKNMLGDLISHLRNDLRQFDEPKAQALFETSAEVLEGLQTAFSHYERGAEPGMRRGT
jgi:hypothetical protein